MPPENKIVKLNLETRTLKLKSQNKSVRDIAKILTEESGHTITKSVVHTYFSTRELEKSKAVEMSAKLKVKVAEAEISTIEYRQKVIDGLLDIAENGMSEHVRVQAYKAANDALDSLDARLGKLSPKGPTVNFNNFNLNNVKELPDAELIRIIDQEE